MPEYVIVIIRAVSALTLLFILTRILGKKQISQLTFFDYAVGISLGAMTGKFVIDTSIPFINGVIGLTVFTALAIIINFGTMKSFKFRDLIESSPSILIKNGQVLEKSLFKNKLTFDDLMMELREKGTFKLAEVELAVLETNGEISVLKQSEYQPLTPKDLEVEVEKEHMPLLIIIDGKLLEERINYLGYTKDWLMDELMKQGAKDFSDVFLAQMDSKGQVYVDLYEDKENTTK